jgi:hypothetical protein
MSGEWWISEWRSVVGGEVQTQRTVEVVDLQAQHSKKAESFLRDGGGSSTRQLALGEAKHAAHLACHERAAHPVAERLAASPAELAVAGVPA